MISRINPTLNIPSDTISGFVSYKLHGVVYLETKEW